MAESMYPPHVVKILGQKFSIEEAWRIYRIYKVEQNEGHSHSVIAKQAFFAGFLSLLEFQHHIIGDDVISEDHGVEIMTRLYNEAIEFGRKYGLILE